MYSRGGGTMKPRETRTRIVRPLRSGQITIPAAFREQLGITAESLLQVTLADGELRIRPVRTADTAAGSPWFKELHDYFAPARREAADRGYSEEEIDAAIDAAVNAVRRQGHD
jgi:AbrB family looped-hinge helix DNA binding protein